METLPIYTDMQGLAALRADAIDSADDTLEEAARQFSAIFTHMLLKSMRQASVGEGIFDSQQSDFYRDMFDQQIALQMTQGEGLGFTKLLVDQFKPFTQADSQSQVKAYEDVSQLPAGGDTKVPASSAANQAPVSSRISAAA